jgi:tetratricopeptide (TPR) repeat protein
VAGDYAAAADRGLEAVAANPDMPLLLYNTACCESLAGRTDDAIEHLRAAIERKDDLRKLAAEDSDFDPVREEARFRELVGT